MRAVARDWLGLTKPGITLFIGVTAAAGFITAAGGVGNPRALLLTLAATMLMSAGAAALNQVAERAPDAVMRRTAGRPLPAGRIPLPAATAFGWGLSAAGLALSLLWLPLPTGLFLVICHLTYVYAYTPLKRRTPLCTLAGAVPGALPVLAGWTATGQPLDAAAVALTGVLFMWQIPHFLAIGWMAREDYRAAGCPMLAVVECTGRSSARVSLVYALAMVVCSGFLGLSAGLGGLYMAIALMTGGVYVACATGFVRRPEPLPARRLFFSSIIVLPVLLAGLVADIALG